MHDVRQERDEYLLAMIRRPGRKHVEGFARKWRFVRLKAQLMC